MIRPCLAPPGGVLNGLSATPDWRGGNTRAGAHEHVDTKIDGELRLQVAHEPCQRPSQGPLLPGVSSHGPCIALSMLPPTGGRSSQARCLSLRPALGSPPAPPPPLLLHGFFFLFLGGPSPPSSPLSSTLICRGVSCAPPRLREPRRSTIVRTVVGAPAPRAGRVEAVCPCCSRCLLEEAHRQIGPGG
jgi:hypothetical protein